MAHLVLGFTLSVAYQQRKVFHTESTSGPTQGNEWLKYSGRWGTTLPLTGDSPPTPSFQGWWHAEEGEPNLLGSNGTFHRFLLQTGTPIGVADGENNFAYWGLAEYNGDAIPDLFGVKVRNTGSDLDPFSWRQAIARTILLVLALRYNSNSCPPFTSGKQ